MRCRKIEKKKFIAESPEYFLRVKKNFHPKPTNSIRKKRKEKKEDIYIYHHSFEILREATKD